MDIGGVERMTLNMTEENKWYYISKLNVAAPHLQHLAGLGLRGNRAFQIYKNNQGAIIVKQGNTKIVLDKTVTQLIEVKECEVQNNII